MNNFKGQIVIGLSIFLGLLAFGLSIKSSVIAFKRFERTVTVKGLSERELPADTVIWPIVFSTATNDINELYDQLDYESGLVLKFLKEHGIKPDEINIGIPEITDKFARKYSDTYRARFRYTAQQTITVCSKRVDTVRSIMKAMVELGKQGVVFSGDPYETKPEFLFTKLNKIKPVMIEEATKKAREVALKFAKDSNSRLGKIKRARQGQFSIRDRDKNTPWIKKIRVVSTVEYYLID